MNANATAADYADLSGDREVGVVRTVLEIAHVQIWVGDDDLAVSIVEPPRPESEQRPRYHGGAGDVPEGEAESGTPFQREDRQSAGADGWDSQDRHRGGDDDRDEQAGVDHRHRDQQREGERQPAATGVGEEQGSACGTEYEDRDRAQTALLGKCERQS